MNCIKCGKKISDGELFCIECSLLPKVPAPAAPKAASKAKPAAEKSPRDKGHGAPAHSQKPSAQPQRAAKPVEAAPVRKRPVGLAVTMVVFLLVSLALGAFIFLNWGKLLEQRANLRVREADLTLREADMQELEQQLSTTQSKLDAAMTQNETLTKQVEDLTKQLNGTQSTVSQTQYDMTSQQQQLEKLAAENTELSALLDAQEQAAADLTKQLTALSATSAAYATKADFMDTYVVFVNNDGSNYYHKYSCSDFKRQSFWAYSRKLAENNGFLACPNCG